ncbi:MAG: RecX family transcriptional regulator [Acidobacteria bacterium]|nr:RecX family transcriptional regulator [Acidobacteriota bacterium]
MLGLRELSERRLRERLLAREFPADDVNAAVARLRDERALDDDRLARAYARTAMTVKRRGRLRVLRELDQLGIGRETARAAVDEAFAESDERTLIERALARRLKGGITTPAHFRRLLHYLLRQGFSSAAAITALRARANPAVDVTDPDRGR